MKTLFFLRHAKSDWATPDIDDHDRPLSPRGHRSAHIMAEYLRERLDAVELVVCSTAVRARHTLDAFLPALDSVPVRYERAVYTFSASALAARISTLPETAQTVLVVGHNPALFEVAASLVADTDVSEQAALLRDKYSTGAFAAFSLGLVEWADFAKTSPGQVRLDLYLRPKDILS